MMRFKKILAVVLTAALSLGMLGGLTLSSPTTVEAATFTDLNQNEIVAAMGAGWNLGNQLEASIGGVPSETAWGNPTITESLIKAVKNAGFSTIRIPVSYLNKIGSGSSYTIDSSWLNRVQEVVDMCINNGLYVIINMHGDGYNSVDGGWLLCNSSDQTTIRAKYKACWQQIATKFKDYDEHLIFESMNEEFDGTYGTPNSTYYSNINTLNQIFVDTVRQTGGNNAMRWLLIPGWNTNIEYTAGNYGFVIPSDNYRSSSISSSEKRIMISVHYYDPWDFCGTESSDVTLWSNASYGDESYLNGQFYNLYSSFTSKGYPVVIGEYGAIDKSAYNSSNTASRCEWAKKVCYYSQIYGCVPVWWDNGYTGTYGFALFDRSTYKVTQQDLVDAIIGQMGTGSSSSGSSSSGSSASGTVIFSNGSSGESYSTSDASWLTNASDSDVITLQYTCTDSSHAYWGILGWGASVNGSWVNGSSYSADSTATNTVTVTFTAGELKSSLGITGSSSVGYLALSAYNGGKIISLSIASSGSSSSGSSSSSDSLEGVYYIKSYYSGLYLDIVNGSSSNGANLQQWSYNGCYAQKFELVSAGDGYYYIYTGASNYSKVIDVSGKSKADGANIIQYAYNGQSNQKFKITEVQDGVYAILTGITSGASCLDVYGWSSSAGGNIAQWTYWGGACQLWYLEATSK
ncbi:MAG: cellulase family glycosylhydrolase [Butyrivibrio sp.]